MTQAKRTGFLPSIALLAAILWFSSVQMSLAGGIPKAGRTVKVLYAGSLVNLMEHGIGPDFGKATGNKFDGYGGGSNGLAVTILHNAPNATGASPFCSATKDAGCCWSMDSTCNTRLPFQHLKISFPGPRFASLCTQHLLRRPPFAFLVP